MNTLEKERQRIREAQQKKYEEQAKKFHAEKKKAKRSKTLGSKDKFNADDHDHFKQEFNPLMGGSSGGKYVSILTCTRLLNLPVEHEYILLALSSSLQTNCLTFRALSTRITRRYGQLPSGGGG